MNRSHVPTDVGSALRSMQVIAAGLLSGVLVFGLIAFLAAGEPKQAEQPYISYAALVMAVACLGIRLVIPDLVARQALQKLTVTPSDTDDLIRARLAGVYSGRLVIGLALCESAAFFNLIAWMVERSPLSLGTVTALVLVMVSAFPTRPRLDRWIDRQVEKVSHHDSNEAPEDE